MENQVAEIAATDEKLQVFGLVAISGFGIWGPEAHGRLNSE